MFVDYDTSGEIISCISCSRDQLVHNPPRVGCERLEIPDKEHIEDVGLYYVDVDKKIMKIKGYLSVEVSTDQLYVELTGVPRGSIVEVKGLTTKVTDDEPLTIEFDIPSTYTIKIIPPPQYTAETLEVIVGDI